jgi:hypothetical protein
MDIVCTITVLAFHFFSKVDLPGKIISSGATSSSLLVDFSTAAKARGFEGDYSMVVVAKSDCVELHLKKVK